jgi:histidinol-phosphate aminotransferase
MLAQGKVCTVVNPNNPTGNLLLNADSAERLLDSCEYLVVDEAYYEFCGVTTVPLLRRYENLIVFRTFSKAFGLAGARIGYMIAHPTVIELFSKSCEVYRVSTPSMMLAQKALENKWYMVEYVGMVKKEMERLIKGLSAMGISAYPSEGNFILVEKGFGQFLTEYGYQVKTFDGFARMTVPAPPVTDEVLAIAENYGR